MLSAWGTNFLLVYLPIDLLCHYMVRLLHERDRVDDLYAAGAQNRSPAYQPEAYQGVMTTRPSLVAFGLKIALFVFECTKYKFSYDMGPDYKKLKDAYVDAESSAFPSSKPLPPGGLALREVGGDRGQVPQALQGENRAATEEQKAEDRAEEQHSDSSSFLVRVTQQNALEAQRRALYNQRLKLQYVKIFRKSTSFVHKIMKPISLFMLCLIQLMFILAHPSVLFVVLLGLSLSGFFVSLKDFQEQHSFFLRAQALICIEGLYVVVQYLINVIKVEAIADFQKREDSLILLGVGSEQQLGYCEDERNLQETFFPFNLSIVLLLVAAAFTRYLGKPSLPGQRGSLGASRRNGHFQARRRRGELTETSSEIQHGGSEDDVLTVMDDGQSMSALSDIRS